MPVDSEIFVCPGEQQLLDLIAGTLPATERTRVLAHTLDCAQCRSVLRRAGASAAALVEGAAQPDTLSQAPPHSTGTAATHRAVTPGPAATASLADGNEIAARAMLAPPRGPGELGRLGAYKILRVLGEGGMGIVFEAEDTTLGRRVAIKVLRQGEFDPSQRKRFLQEAQLAASLSSDRIVTIHQVGEDAGCLFIVMELLGGESLEARLRRDGWLPLVESLRIAREIAEGLTVAHNQRLVHRDIKPANVWLESRHGDEHSRRVKLLDFGVARPLAVHEHLTGGGHIIGTPGYMSPEQACGLPIDERSDLFSLGCVLYIMLSGNAPFERGNYVQTLHAVVDEQPRPLVEILPGLPTKLLRLVERLLNKDPQARPSTARQVVEELRHIEQNLTTGDLVMPAPSTAATAITGFARRRQKFGWGVWLGVLAIAAAALLGGWGQYQRLRGLAQSETPSMAALPVDGSAAPASVSVASVVPMLPSTLKAPPAAPAAADPSPPAGEQATAESVTNADEDSTPAAVIDSDLPTIKVGIIHSLSGPMAASERPIVDAVLMAIDDINSQGGLLGGRAIEAVVRDGRSNERIFAEQAEDLIVNEQVATLFGCWRSPCRKLVADVCQRHKHLLIYPTTYEGMEDSPYVVYLGGAPNQQVLPAVKWAFAFLGKRKFYLIGGDGIYSRTIHEIIRDELAELGGQVVGEGFRPQGCTDYAAIAQEVVDSQADVVINTVSGMGNVSVFQALHFAGVTADKVPTICFKVGEEELQAITGEDQDAIGDYAAWSYFQSLDNSDNLDFIENFRQRYGPTRVTTDPMAAAYAGVFLWARAVSACESADVAEIRKELLAQDFAGPEGDVSIEAENRHAWRRALIGRVNESLQFDIVWSSPQPIRPEPFPASRSREEWEKFQRDLYREWGNNWRPDGPRK